MKFNDAYSQMFPGYPDAVSLQQAAEMLGLNRHTVGELIRSRRLFALKIGRTYRIPKLSVIEFLLTGQSTFPAGNPPLDVVCCGCRIALFVGAYIEGDFFGGSSFTKVCLYSYDYYDNSV